MTIEVRVPILPESVADATVANWHKKPGDRVSRDENLVDIETDKVMLEVPSPQDGVLKEILHKQGSTVHGEDVLAVISVSAEEPAANQENTNWNAPITTKPATPNTAPKTVISGDPLAAGVKTTLSADAGPSARREAVKQQVPTTAIVGSGKGGRVTKQDVVNFAQDKTAPAPATSYTDLNEPRSEKRVPMSRLRTRIAERLLSAQHNAAILTTFNEVNLSAVIELRNRYKDQFQSKHGVKLGFMSFFVKAAIEALKRYPVVNASIDGNDIVYHGYFDIGVAVSTERGLVVPVLRDADQMSLAEIEIKIAEYGEKARNGQLTIEEMSGGTFTVSNGGVFGSLLSTPILNPPQSAILGMHKTEDRPVAENGQVVIRPMMYVAMSYDHRIIDGRESVTFLRTIKEVLEDPARILLGV